MQTVKMRSFGVVPVSIELDGAAVFLILRAFKNWDFPKGGAEADETPVAAATREFNEETGLRQLTFDWGMESIDTAIYANGKVATYYLAHVEKQEITLPVSAELGRPEHDEYRWVSADEARTLLPLRLVPILDWAVRMTGGR